MNYFSNLGRTQSGSCDNITCALILLSWLPTPRLILLRHSFKPSITSLPPTSVTLCPSSLRSPAQLRVFIGHTLMPEWPQLCQWRCFWSSHLEEI